MDQFSFRSPGHRKKRFDKRLDGLLIGRFAGYFNLFSDFTGCVGEMQLVDQSFVIILPGITMRSITLEPTMGYALTSKSQVTVPKQIREQLGVGPGQEIDYEALPDGRVVMFPVRRPAGESRFTKWRGVGVLKMPTDDIMRMTRGEDWNA